MTEFVKVLAEVTLALILFHDAAQVRPRQIEADRGLILRLLLVGLPLTVLVGFFAARVAFPGMPVMIALLVATALSPTDAIGRPGRFRVRRPHHPERVEQPDHPGEDRISTVICSASGRASGVDPDDLGLRCRRLTD